MKKGKLTIFTSYTPGAGKSFFMVSKAMEQKEKGVKVLIAFLNGRHRKTDVLLEANDVSDFHGERYSLSAIFDSKPELVVMDEMGMQNINIDGHTFVYEDIEKLLQAGIDVYASSNLKRFEGANPLFKQITGIGIKKTIPDRFLDMAEKIYFVNRAPELMQKDFEEGTLFSDKYMHSKIKKKNFRPETLKEYRRISLEYLENYNNIHIIVRK